MNDNLKIVLAYIAVILLAVIAISLAVSAAELVHYLHASESAWTAPWVNTIVRNQ